MLKYRQIIIWMALILTLGLEKPVFSQQMVTVSPTSARTPSFQCELHIWPANRFSATTTLFPRNIFGDIVRMLGSTRLAENVSLGPVGLVDANFHKKGDKRRLAAMVATLDANNQLKFLEAANPAERLDRQYYQIHLHDEFLDRKTASNIEGRRSLSLSPCYAELIVTDVKYRRAYLGGSGGVLRTLFLFREFGDSNTLKSSYKSWKSNKLNYFPPKYDEEIDVSIRELSEVFHNNFVEFSKKVPRKPYIYPDFNN